MSAVLTLQPSQQPAIWPLPDELAKRIISLSISGVEPVPTHLIATLRHVNSTWRQIVNHLVLNLKITKIDQKLPLIFPNLQVLQIDIFGENRLPENIGKILSPLNDLRELKFTGLSEAEQRLLRQFKKFQSINIQIVALDTIRLDFLPPKLITDICAKRLPTKLAAVKWDQFINLKSLVIHEDFAYKYNFTSELIKKFSKIPLKALEINGKHLSLCVNLDLQELNASLISLKLKCFLSGPRSLSPLSRLENLRILHIKIISNLNALHIATLTELQELSSIGYCSYNNHRLLTDDGVAHLQMLTALTKLALPYYSSVTANGLGNFSNLADHSILNSDAKKLSFDFSFTNLNDKNFLRLGNMGFCKCLIIANCVNLSVHGLNKLFDIGQLQELDISHNQHLRGVLAITKLTQLTKFSANSTKIGASVLLAIATLTRLNHLSIANCPNIAKPPWAHWDQLGNLSQLTHLHASGHEFVSSYNFDCIERAEHERTFERLLHHDTLSSPQIMLLNQLVSLRALMNLRHLSLSKRSDIGGEALSIIGKMTQLQSFGFRSNQHVDRARFIQLRELSQLTHLDLKDTQVGGEALINQPIMRRMRTLRAYLCPNLTRDDVQKIQQQYHLFLNWTRDYHISQG